MALFPAAWQTVGLLFLSHVFMTFVWHRHLKGLAAKPWWIAAFISRGIALFEYCCRCPRTASTTAPASVWRS